MVGTDSGTPPIQAPTQACSALAAAEPLAGTAPYARAWIAIEQPGSWGRDAFATGVLPHDIGPTLIHQAKRHEVGALLIRHPNRPRQLVPGASRMIWLAHIDSNSLVALTIGDYRELLTWDFAALAAGNLQDVPAEPATQSTAQMSTDPVALVCCHAARDACCAIQGRALYDALYAQAPPATALNLWQCSHLGGHRFAPTMLVLPLGAVYGRLTVEHARTVIREAARGQLVADNCRGRTTVTAPVQAAEVYLRTVMNCTSPGDLTLSLESADEQNAIVSARHHDGRAWRLTMQVQDCGPLRPVSCGAEPGIANGWRVISQE
mgnify:CR=1 FL=1